jgi:hypothetical protein
LSSLLASGLVITWLAIDTFRILRSSSTKASASDDSLKTYLLNALESQNLIASH